MIIKQVKEFLTDGSEVFNLDIIEDGITVYTFHCVSEFQSESLINAIRETTVDVERVTFSDNLIAPC